MSRREGAFVGCDGESGCVTATNLIARRCGLRWGWVVDAHCGEASAGAASCAPSNGDTPMTEPTSHGAEADLSAGASPTAAPPAGASVWEDFIDIFYAPSAVFARRSGFII